MRFTVITFFKSAMALGMLMGSGIGFSQESREEKLLMVKANELSCSNPDETIKIATHLLKKQHDAETLCTLNLLMGRGYVTKGDYNKSLSYIFEAGQTGTSVSDSLKAEVLFYKAEILRKLHLNKLSSEYLAQAKPYVEKPDGYFNSRLMIEEAATAIEAKDYKKALGILRSGPENQNVLSPKIVLLQGMAEAGLNHYDKAEKLFNTAFDLYNGQRQTNKFFEAKVLCGLANIYNHNREYEKGKLLLTQAMERAVALDNASLQKEVYFLQAEIYKAQGDMVEYQRHFDKFLTFSTKENDTENEAVNSLYNLISNEQDAQYASAEKGFLFYSLLVLAILLAVIVSGTLLYRSNKNKRKRLKEIIGYLEVSNKLLVKSYPEKKETVKKITISNETEQAILAKLKKFENSGKYTHKDMSLATLAAQLDVNTKYLSEVINKHYNDNFNTYINRLRINYIIEKLKNEPEYLNYKISYLAEESGFASHSTFATVFKSITGIAPTVFIELIGKEVNQKKA